MAPCHERNGSHVPRVHFLPSQAKAFKGSSAVIWHLKHLFPGTFCLFWVCFHHRNHIASYFLKSPKLELGELSAVNLKPIYLPG